MVSLGQVIALIKAMGGSGGGSSLPSVSSTDNGDVLTVVNGAWDKAAPSGLPAVTSADNGKGLSVQNGAWAVDAYAGWDAVIKVYSDGYDWTVTAVKGDYATVVAKMQAGQPVMIYFYGHFPEAECKWINYSTNTALISDGMYIDIDGEAQQGTQLARVHWTAEGFEWD